MSTPMTDRIKFPSGFWEGLSLLNIEAHDVARRAGLHLSIINETYVTVAQYFAIWQAYSDLAGDTAEGIVKLATVYETAKYPPPVLATYHARDYRDALNRMARYKQMCPPESLQIVEEGESCMIGLNLQTSEKAEPPILIGITLTHLMELGRRGTGQHLTAKLVEFTQPMGNVQVLEDYFGCDVRTGASCNRLTLYRRDLDRPFLTYNEELLEILTPAIDRTLEYCQRGRSLAETVKWILKRSLMGGRPDVRLIADEVGMSDRTLQRRLTNEGTTFKNLLMQTRHEQAREYLADPSIDIKEVAFLIGYEDQNSFYRAFRLWEGDTPANWRSKQVR